jgi:SRSO17 transposase
MIYVKGLLSDLERKSVEPIALRYGGKSKVRLLQLFISNASWSEGEMSLIYRCRLAEEVSEPDGMLTVDGCDFLKKGTESVGVARQYCGILGRRESCQASIMIGYCGSQGYGLIDRRLYLPEKWMSVEYEAKRKKCGIPDEAKFTTKTQIAIDMINSLVCTGLFEARWIGADSSFGHDKFIDDIPAGMYYFIEVHGSDSFYPISKGSTIAFSGNGRQSIIEPSVSPVTVSQIINDSQTPWQPTVFGFGLKGFIEGEEKLLRVFNDMDGHPRDRIWLYARKLADGNVKCAISNAPEGTLVEKFRELSLRRWSIEQCLEESQLYLGMGHHEGRTWSGWHRHILIVFVTHLFLAIIRKKYSADVS